MKFRKWVKYLLIIINIIAFVILASEVKDLKVFVISKLIAITIFGINSKLLINYGGLNE